jgi:1-acyl-sn-glycerol-3-phosphate acyltransferase
MQRIFLFLYDLFSRRKLIFWLVFLSSFACWLVLALRIKPVEDVASMLPDSKAIRAMNDVISHTQAGEQIVFLVSFNDSTKTDPDSLISATEYFHTQLQEKCGEWIDTVTTQAAGSYEEALTEILSNNIPLFLTEKDYERLDTMLQPEQIDKTLEANRKILLSPASVVLKNMVAKDPIGISNLVWGKLKLLQFDPGYETYDGYLFTGGQKQLTFFLKPKYKAAETGKNATFFESLNELVDEWEQHHSGVHLSYFGGPAVAAGNATQLRTDTILTLSVTIVLLLALTYYYFRRKRTPLLLLVPVAYGAAMGLGIVYLAQGHISVISLGAGAIILGIAIDFSIHFLSHARHAGSIRETVKDMAQPLTIGSFTTVAAFLSLRLVHTPVLQDIGLFAAGSLIGAALCTLVFLPHLPIGIDHLRARDTVFDKIGRLRPEKNKWLVLFIFLLTPVMLYFTSGIKFDSNLMHLNYLSPRMKQAEQEVSKVNAFALSSVFVVANEQDEEHALQQLELLQPQIDSLVQKGSIRSVSNPVIFLPSKAEQQKRIERWHAYWNEGAKKIVSGNVKHLSQKHGFSETAFDEFDVLINSQAQSLDAQSTTVLRSFFPGSFSADADNHYAIAALKVPQEHRKEVFDKLQGRAEVTITDRQQGANQLAGILNKDFTNIALYSSLIVFFALLLSYGRIELAIIAFLPMVISWVWILGLTSLMGLEFNIVNIIISSLIFGLGDDYTIFTMDGMVEKYKHGRQKLESVRAAVYVSVLTVIIGLGVLLLAKHPALRSISFISVTGLVCVLFISQTLQPFLFNWFIQNRADKKFHPFTLKSFVFSIFAFAYFFTGSLVLTILGVILTKLWPFNKEESKYWFHVCVSRYTWSMMYIMSNITKRIYNIPREDFKKPAVYIANHSSFLDILIITMLHPRLVLLTNKWVWRSPVFGAVVRMAEYYPVAEGADDSIEPLKSLVDRGYSIVIFPEGTRAYDDKISRFHKGAFFIAEKLKLDVVPIILHGVHYAMQKGDWLLKDGTCSVYIRDRIQPGDVNFGSSYSERAKLIGREVRNEFAAIKRMNETPAYFREQLVRSYTYKGPVLEWYCRIKIKLEDNYEPFHKLLPQGGVFYDLGCGYGFMTYMLHWAAESRKFIGIDYDHEKIETAQHIFLRSEAIRFEQGDLTQIKLQPCDGIIISDVLHYLLQEQQEALLEECYASLNNNGVLIIRDGVYELKDRIKGTKLTELFSTRVFKFNKTQNELQYISKVHIEFFATAHNMELEILDNAKFTANLTFVLRKKSV